MSDASKPFAFSQFVPGFDFLRNLASGGAAASASAVPGMPSLSSWVAPTLSVEEVEKRIQELKTVQFWLEQNGHALKATIQALEVQKMTLSTLRGMNVQMEDLASVFTRQAAATPAFSTESPPPAAAAASKAKPQAEEEVEPKETGAPAGPEGAAGAAGVVDPLQWWGALTQQFQQIASSALHEASQVKMPMMPPLSEAHGEKRPAASGKAPRKTATAASSKKSAGGRSAAGSSTSPTPARKRARGH